MTFSWLRETAHHGRWQRDRGEFVVRFVWPRGVRGNLRVDHAKRVLAAREWWDQMSEEERAA